MSETTENYIFPWGFHLGDLHKDSKTIPLYTGSQDGGFCLLYDKESEKKADNILQGICLELLSSMPHESLRVDMFDFGRKKFYNLSPLKSLQLYNNAYDDKLCDDLFDRLESLVVSRYTDILCCNRQTIDEHNQKSKMKQEYHLVLINLDVFPRNDIKLRRIQNFVESAQKAGVYIIAFGEHSVEESSNEMTQTILKNFKKLRITKDEFDITPEIFEFPHLLDDHVFKPLDLDKSALMQKVLMGADLESFLNPDLMKLEENTKVL